MHSSVTVGSSVRAETPPEHRSILGDMRDGWSDIRAGWGARTIWWTLATNEVASRYRRTVIGPFWVTLQMAVWVAGISFLYGQLFNADLAEFVPYVALGMLMWQLVSGTTIEASHVFIGAAGFIKSSSLPISTYAYQLVLRQLIFFLHSTIAVVLVLVILRPLPSINVLWAAPIAVALALFNGFFFSLWLGIAAARFRDVGPFIAAALNFLMFLTPIFWLVDQVGRPAWIIGWNPFAWFVIVFREGFLGHPVSWLLWALIVGLTIVNTLVTLVIFGRSRRRLAYWI